MQGIFFGLGQMQGLGLQHLHGMGFIMAKLEAPDGLPVFSGPSYIEIASTRAGVGAGQLSLPPSTLRLKALPLMYSRTRYVTLCTCLSTFLSAMSCSAHVVHLSWPHLRAWRA